MGCGEGSTLQRKGKVQGGRAAQSRGVRVSLDASDGPRTSIIGARRRQPGSQYRWLEFKTGSIWG
jgi:hypothetical protein